MVTFTCPICGKERTGKRHRCYQCTKTVLSEDVRERIRKALTGRRLSEEHKRKVGEGQKNNVNRFDLAGFMRGRKPYNFRSAGSTRKANGHMTIKCNDGKWRYRARVIWETAYGNLSTYDLIHHINRNPYDDKLENLQKVTRAEHARIHKPKLKIKEG